MDKIHIMRGVKTLLAVGILFMVVGFSLTVSAVPAAGNRSKVGTSVQTRPSNRIDRYDPAVADAAMSQKILQKKAIQTFVIIVVGYLLIFLLTTLINNQVKNVKVKHVTRKTVIYSLTVMAILLIVSIWIQYIGSVAVLLGVVGAGVALALQEAVLCVAGWFLIIARHPFRTGDRIELSGVKGDVIDIRLFQTSLLEIGNWVGSDQSTGRIVHVPNSAVFKKENFNYNQGFEFIWNEVGVVLTFESDWKRAEEIMLNHGISVASGKEDVVKQKIDFMTRRYMIKYGKLTPIVYVDMKENGVHLTLRYLSEARSMRTTSDILWRSILTDFEKEDKITLAYPTYRIVKA